MTHLIPATPICHRPRESSPCACFRVASHRADLRCNPTGHPHPAGFESANLTMAYTVKRDRHGPAQPEKRAQEDT